MKKFVKNIKDYIHSTYLCIRFPFLYQRNRFTGKHYNNWKIHDKIKKAQSQYTQFFSFNLVSPYFVQGIKDKSIQFNNAERFIKQLITINNRDIRVYIKNDCVCFEIVQGTNIQIENIPYTELFKDETIPNISNVYICEIHHKFYGSDKESIGYTIYVESLDYTELKDEWITCRNIVINPYKKYVIKFYNFIHNILEVFHCIPKYTELYSMEEGWLKAFGIQMCKEIKHSLIYTYINKENIKPTNIFKYIKAYYKGLKLLYTYRITDIKSKYGYLHWYDAWSTEDVQNIINKYEHISYNTCWICGKPADYITTGWIDPYCKDCISENERPYAKEIIRKEDGTIEYIGPGTDEE